jgi:ferrous iron transport protein B
MSTIVTVRRETNSWKIPALQFAFLFGLAYALAFAGYRLTLAFLS